MAHPDALIDIEGAFGLGCSEMTDVVISFGDDERVSKVSIAAPDGECV